MQRKMLLVVVSVVVLLAGVLVAAAQGPTPQGPLQVTSVAGTGFTYQGQLKSGGEPINATCNFIFKLFDNPTAGVQVGSNFTATVPITNGLFTTVLDFGMGALTGDARWLDMQVKCPTAVVYTPLLPRQALTPAPMALALPGLWTQQNPTSTNLIGGYSGNVISPTVYGATIGGGGDGTNINRILDPGLFATIGGGEGNRISAGNATVGGGEFNTANGDGATVGGGNGNTADNIRDTVGGGSVNNASGGTSTVGGGDHNIASATDATVAGGHSNKAYSDSAAVGGGESNTAGFLATVPGGRSNTASGSGSFAAGQHANTNLQAGAFVWGDSSVTTEISATAPNQFLIRAVGGVGIGTDSPKASFEVISARNGGSDNTATFGNPALGPNFSHIHYGTTGDWYIRSASAAGTVILQDSGGNVGIGTASPSPLYKLDVSGKMRATGFSGVCRSDGITGSGPVCNQDVAETFAATERTRPGDLVVLVAQATATPTVRKSAQPYDSLLVGVVSQNPGLIFDAGQTNLAGDNTQFITDDKTVVALVGRVLVNVSLENGPIALGDPLTSASQPGAAMKATRAGKIIGYALEAADHAGQVLLLVQPGYFAPADGLLAQSVRLLEQNDRLQAKVDNLERQNETTQARLAALEQSHPTDGSMPAMWLLVGGALALGVVVLRRRR